MNRYKYLDGFKRAKYYAGQLLRLRKHKSGRLENIMVIGPEPRKRFRWIVIGAGVDAENAKPGGSSEKSLEEEYEPI